MAMKRLLAVVLTLCTLLRTLISYSSSLATEKTKTAEPEITKTEEAKKEDKGEIVYPKSFSVGYGRAEISPPLPVTIDNYGDGMQGEILREKLYATCAAVCDGENVALMFSLDMKQSTADVIQQFEKSLEKTLGIPASNVTFTAIGEAAFAAENSITSVAISKNVKSAGTNAFNGCTKLADVWFEGTSSDKTAITTSSAGNSCFTGAA